MNIYDIAVIPGDGIGKEVVPASLEVLNTVAEVHGGLKFNFTSYPWSCDYYLEHGKMMPDNGIQILQNYTAVFLGAVGDPQRVPDHVSLWGLLIKIRREFEQVINIRPAKYIKGIQSPLHSPNDFDLIVVRENSEGEYSEIGGRIHKGEDEVAIQGAVFTRKGTERAIRYGFKLAEQRKGRVTSATKSNGIVHSMPFWDDVFNEVRKDYPASRRHPAILMPWRHSLSPARTRSMSLSQAICSGIFSPIWERPSWAASASRRQPILTSTGNIHPCSSPYTVPHPILSARGLLTP